MNKNVFRMGVLAAALAAAMASSTGFAAAVSPTGNPARMNLTALQAQPSFDRFIVTYRQGSIERANHAAAVQAATAALGRAGLVRATRTAGAPASVSMRYQRKLAVGADLLRTSRPLDRTEAAALIRQLSIDPAVAYVVPDVLRHRVRDLSAAKLLQPQTVTPNDTYYAKYQWNLKAPDGTVTTGGNANLGGTSVNHAWDLSDGTGVVIAVLDTGITTHVDVDTSLGDAGYDFIVDSFVSGRATDGRVPGGWDTGDWTTEEPWLSECTDADHPPEDSSWHGTHVASTAGAEITNNALGMAGIAHGAKILPVRVLGHCGGYDSDINDAIVWAAGGHVDGVPDNTHPAKVINLSLGGPGNCPASDPAAQAVAAANALGAVVVVSAGNENIDASQASPASCPGVITVASTGITSRRAFYSNYGSAVEIAAPGGGVYPNDGSSGTPINDGFIWQALNSGTTTPVPNDSDYGGYAGTSQASPHVAGTVALMQSARLAAGLPLMTPAEVLTTLQQTAHAPSVAPPANRGIGAGIVDANAAVRAAIGEDDGGGEAIVLGNGVTLAGQSGSAGGSTVYTLQVPAGAMALSLRTYGGSGNVSVYAKVGAAASASDYDYKSARPGNSESVVVARPAAGTWYLTVVGETAYAGVSVLGSFRAPR
ncbi:S8 family serine peptidase [Rhodanobacter caeni]|uniref:S8 family peptidase n=1 Tax=Rhodanobacter caeni TaxID=657654 RepID=A0ABP3E0R4_9GAMM